ncbi:MAG: LysR family transcriptional regulator [Verrucomicrobiaceae bacterium]|nr:LysR family transcriptional regulator [Verrucomicrobiaceae bacterium]
MEFHQLRYFISAAELLNISRAAEAMHISQPALSRQIALLEDELGVPLFDRIKKRIHLTNAGRFFLAKARQIVCDAETSVQQVREQFGNAQRTLRLGFLTPFLDDLVVPALREFRQRHVQTQISLFELSPRAQLDRLRNHEIDAAIVGNLNETDRAQFNLRSLGKHAMAAVLPDSHALSKRRSVKLAALAGEKWISLADAVFPGRRDFLRNICLKAGFEPMITLEVDTLAMMLGAVSAGDGIALMPTHSQKLPHSGCIYVPLASPVPTTELFIVTRPQPQDRELQTLATLISEVAARNAG